MSRRLKYLLLAMAISLVMWVGIIGTAVLLWRFASVAWAAAF